MGNPDLIKNYTAGGAIGANLICKPGSSDFAVLLAAAASDALFGVSTNIDTDSGEPCDVIHSGIAAVKLGGTVTRGNLITADSNGKGVAASVSCNVIGIALASGVSGDIIPVLVVPFAYTITAGVQEVVAPFATDGAITAKRGVAMLTKATAGAYTLAAPTAGTDDGKQLAIMSGTAAAHTVTQTTPGYNNGGTASDVATFGGAIGDSLELVAYNGVWYIKSLRNVTLG